MKNPSKAKKIRFRVLAVLAGIFTVLTFIFAFFTIADDAADLTAHVTPSYEKADLSPLLDKYEWTEEDYDILYHQTGLGKAPLDEMRSTPDRILAFQEALFHEGKITHSMAAPTTPHDMLDGYVAPIVSLQTGDVLVSSSCHTFGWKNGHSAIVVNGQGGVVLESVNPNSKSRTNSTAWFQYAANFIVLRLKDANEQTRKEIGQYAYDHLLGIPYSLTVGFFGTPKDQGRNVVATNCSHLVWQAYKAFGYDIDGDDGIATSRDIANCPLFEVIQVYGFDPDTLWKE